MAKQSVSPTAEVRTARLTPDEAVALKKFSEEAEQIWVATQNAQSALRVAVHFLADSSELEPDTCPEDIVEALSLRAGMGELLCNFIRDLQRSIDRFDYAQMDFRPFLDALTPAAEKVQA